VRSLVENRFVAVLLVLRQPLWLRIGATAALGLFAVVLLALSADGGWGLLGLPGGLGSRSGSGTRHAP
jgi:hypothetical protein